MLRHRTGRALLARGPRALYGRAVRLGEGPWRPRPGYTLPEWRVYWYLSVRKGWRVPSDFVPQASILGPTGEGLVAKVDFLVVREVRPMVWRVQGEYWHYGLGTSKRAHDALQRRMLEGLGYSVIDLDERDIMRRLEYIVEEAIQGVDHSQGVLEAF